MEGYQSVKIKPQTVAPQGLPTSAPMPQTPQQPMGGSMQGMQGAESLFGGQITPLQLLLGTGLIKQGKLSQAYSVLKPAKTTAQEQKLKVQKLQGQKLQRQLDGMLTSWDKIPLVQRLPIPGIKRVSPQRAKYETARNLYSQMLITMVADKRITDNERQFYLQMFPSLLTSKSVANQQVEAIKGFVSDFSEIEPPEESAMNIDDLLMLTQQGE